jgi:hypothetical protein
LKNQITLCNVHGGVCALWIGQQIESRRLLSLLLNSKTVYAIG